MAIPGSVISPGKLIAPGGAPGPTGAAGLPGYSLTTSPVIIPAVGATTIVTVQSVAFANIGDYVSVAGAAGSGQSAVLQITAIDTGTNTLTLLNPPQGGGIPLASISQAGLLTQLSGNTTDFVDGSNNCQSWAAWKRYNAIRNPEMMVAQRGNSFAAVVNGQYYLDGWYVQYSGTMVTSIAQWVSNVPPDASGNNWYPHPAYAQWITFTTGQASLGAGNFFIVSQRIEGNLATVLKSNPSSISLLVFSNISGTFTVSLQDSVAGYTYVATGTTVAGQWNRVAIPNIPAFTALGNFPEGTGACYLLHICLGCGSTYTTSTVGSWQSGNYFAATGQTNYAAPTGTQFYFTLVQHEPNPVCTPYIKRELADEWALSQRYLNMYATFYLGYTHDGNNFYDMGKVSIPQMRAVPTLTSGSAYTASAGANGTAHITTGGNGNIVNFDNPGTPWTTGAYVSFTGGLTAEL